MTEHKPGDVVRMKKYPSINMVVLGAMRSPVRKDLVYKLRFENNPKDTHGHLVWAEELMS